MPLGSAVAVSENECALLDADESHAPARERLSTSEGLSLCSLSRLMRAYEPWCAEAIVSASRCAERASFWADASLDAGLEAPTNEVVVIAATTAITATNATRPMTA